MIPPILSLPISSSNFKLIILSEIESQNDGKILLFDDFKDTLKDIRGNNFAKNLRLYWFIYANHLNLINNLHHDQKIKFEILIFFIILFLGKLNPGELYPIKFNLNKITFVN